MKTISKGLIAVFIIAITGMITIQSCRKEDKSVEPIIASDNIQNKQPCYGRFTYFSCLEFNICCLKPVVITPSNLQNLIEISNNLEWSKAYFSSNFTFYNNDIIPTTLLDGLVNGDNIIEYKVKTDNTYYFSIKKVMTNQDLNVLPIILK